MTVVFIGHFSCKHYLGNVAGFAQPGVPGCPQVRGTLVRRHSEPQLLIPVNYHSPGETANHLKLLGTENSRGNCCESLCTVDVKMSQHDTFLDVCH